MHISESPEHRSTKDLITGKLREWTGASIREYPSSGHMLDVFAITSEGISIYVEIIWSPTSENFHRDMSMIQQSDAKVKLVVVNPIILSNEKYVREFSKVAVSQKRIGVAMHGDMFDGRRLIENSDYLNTEFKGAVLSLIRQIQSQGGAISKQTVEFTPPHPRCPDKVPEQLLSNLFPVKECPSILFGAPTSVRKEREVFERLGNEIQKHPFILKSERIYTFENLNNPQSPFSSIISGNKVEEEEVSECTKEHEKRNDVVRLFNLALRVYCRERGLEYDRGHRRFVCLLRNGRDNIFTWRAGSRYSQRAVAKRVYGGDGELLYCRHYAADMRFMFIDSRLFLKIEPTMTFTLDGYRPFPSDRLPSLMSRWLPRQFNNQYLQLVRLWAKYLSRLDVEISIPAGERKIVVAAGPMNARMNIGIADDKVSVSRRKKGD